LAESGVLHVERKLVMSTLLPHDCSHESVEPRGQMPSFAEWEGEPANFLDFEAGWCPGCAHFVRREAGEMDWSAFMAGLPRVA
jgi:hypothetical protein